MTTVSAIISRANLGFMGGQVLIGPAGWAYKDWDGIVYPVGLKRAQHPAEYLARFFDLIEINTSFYGPIRPEHA